MDKKKSRRLWVIAVIIIVLWYGTLAFLPKIGHASLAFPVTIQITLKHLAATEQSYDGVKAQLDSLGWKRSNRGITYELNLAKLNDNTWALTARPNKKKVYYYPLWKRVMFLDFYQHDIHAFRIVTGQEHAEIVR